MEINNFNFIFVSDIVEKNGKTVRENNLLLKHKLPIGSLVEIKNTGVRLFIVAHHRDCDGTPLYMLSPDVDDREEPKPPYFLSKWTGGYSITNLKIIKKHPKKIID